MSEPTNSSEKKSNSVIYDKDDSLGFDVDWNTIEENYKRRHRKRYHTHYNEPQANLSKNNKTKNSDIKEKKAGKKKKIILGILLFLLCLIIGTAGAFSILYYRGKTAFLNYNNLNVSVPDNIDYKDGGNTIYYKGHTYEFNRNIAAILFMGVDNRELKENAIAGTAGQADALYLFTYDTNNGKIRILSLNRDTMTDISRYDEKGNYYDTSRKQLCLAYAYGDGKKLSAENQVTAVERLIYNVPIHAYFAIDLSAIKILNDDVGGVTLTPEYTFGSFTKGQPVTIKGDLAEEFVRHRDVSLLDDNLRRMSCQKLYINSFANQVINATKNNLNVPVKLYQDASDYTVTNIGLSSITYLAPTLALNYSGLEFVSVKGLYKDVPGDNSAEFEVDMTNLFETVLDLFYTQIK